MQAGQRPRPARVSPAQEASAIARRKAIYEELHPETKHGGDRKSDQVDNLATRSERFTAATSQATGKDERTIRRAAARGEKLGDDLKAGRPPACRRRHRVGSRPPGASPITGRLRRYVA